MLTILLDPFIFLVLLIGFAVLTPLVALVLARVRPGWRGRLLFVAGAFGPFTLAFWGFHNLVVRVVGFDAIATPLIVMAVGLACGLSAGAWIRRRPYSVPADSSQSGA
ncbi:MAG: hypothetical protein KF858_01235 [Candidatus Sumerlaeia bacterium]|nr:hypothetical protein [Candidatus Sumerlaeia bacterium]